MDKQVFGTNLSISVSISQKDLECPVCLEEFDISKKGPVTLPCGHDICMTCLNSSKAHKNHKCPSCMKEFPKNINLDINWSKKELIRRIQEVLKCEVHNHSIEYVCITEKKLLCGDCLFYDNHADHKKEKLKSISAKLERLKEFKDKIQESVKAHSDLVYKAIDNEKKRLIEIVKLEFARYKARIADKEKQLLDEITQFFGELKRESKTKVEDINQGTEIMKKIKEYETKKVTDFDLILLDMSAFQQEIKEYIAALAAHQLHLIVKDKNVVTFDEDAYTKALDLIHFNKENISLEVGVKTDEKKLEESKIEIQVGDNDYEVKEYTTEQAVQLITELVRTATALLAQKDYSLALKTLNKAFNVGSKLPDKKYLITVHEALGDTHFAMGRADKAGEHYNTYQQLVEQFLGVGHYENVRALEKYGDFLYNDEEYEKSAKCFDQAIQILKAKMEEESPSCQRCYVGRGRAEIALNSIQAARNSLNPPMKYFQKYAEVYASDYANCLLYHSELIALEGNLIKAEDQMTEAYNLKLKLHNQDDSALGDALICLAKLSLKKKDYEKAKEHAEKAVKIFEKVYGEFHFKVADAMKQLAEANYELGDYYVCIDNFHQVLQILQISFGTANRKVVKLYIRLGQVEMVYNFLQKSKENFKMAYEIAQKTFGESDPLTLLAKSKAL